jgi:hypothetical protein
MTFSFYHSIGYQAASASISRCYLLPLIGWPYPPATTRGMDADYVRIGEITP